MEVDVVLEEGGDEAHVVSVTFLPADLVVVAVRSKGLLELLGCEILGKPFVAGCKVDEAGWELEATACAVEDFDSVVDLCFVVVVEVFAHCSTAEVWGSSWVRDGCESSH